MKTLTALGSLILMAFAVGIGLKLGGKVVDASFKAFDKKTTKKEVN
jgi:hypothetical protein